MRTWASVNVLSVAVAAVAWSVFSFVYYTFIAPPLLAAMGGGFSAQAAAASSAFIPILVSTLTRIVVIAVLAAFIGRERTNLMKGLAIAGLAYVGFILQPAIGQGIFKVLPWSTVLVGQVEALVGLLLSGAIIGGLVRRSAPKASNHLAAQT